MRRSSMRGRRIRTGRRREGREGRKERVCVDAAGGGIEGEEVSGTLRRGNLGRWRSLKRKEEEASALPGRNEVKHGKE